MKMLRMNRVWFGEIEANHGISRINRPSLEKKQRASIPGSQGGGRSWSFCGLFGQSHQTE
jgi:hypothetical protein